MRMLRIVCILLLACLPWHEAHARRRAVNTTVVGATSNRRGSSGDGSPAAQAETRSINGMAVDRFGNVFLMDWENRRVRAIRGIAK